MATIAPATAMDLFHVPVKQEKLTCFIPARSGSKRIPGKNVKLLAGHPLIAHTIATARRTGLFSRIVVSSDSEEYCQISRQYGAEAILRPASLATDFSPDIAWLKYTARLEWEEDHHFDAFCILRPTSPFRGAESVLGAHRAFCGSQVDSLRAVKPCTEHPAKMWVLGAKTMTPILPYKNDGVPWHSNQKSVLPKVYVQTAGMEWAWADTLWKLNSLAGEVIMPYILGEVEGLDLNIPRDWVYAELLLKGGAATLEDPTP